MVDKHRPGIHVHIGEGSDDSDNPNSDNPEGDTYHSPYETSVNWLDDGKIDDEEKRLSMEFKKKELDDQDAMRDAQRKMAWFALVGMLLYPFAVVIASIAGLDQAQATLGDMAPTYFVAVAGIVAAFFGAQAYSRNKN